MRSEEVVRMALLLCEKHLADMNGQVTPVTQALSSSALAIQNATTTFLAIERSCT